MKQMYRRALHSLFLLFLFTLNSWADVTQVVKDQAKEAAKGEVAKAVVGDKEESKEELPFFFSYSYAKKKNDAITVVAGYEIEFEESSYHKFELLRDFGEYTFGLGLDISESADDINSIIGHIGGNKWYLIIEKSTLRGEIKHYSTVKSKFDDNSYLDIKFLKAQKAFTKGVKQHDPSGIGVQVLTYERPSALRYDGTVYYDPKSKAQFIGFVFEMDSVKKKMINGLEQKKHDWYFYNTTALGYGQIELSDETRNESNALAKPSRTKYSGFGLNGEYELGYVFSFANDMWRGSFKVGYNFQIEGPVATDSEDNDRDVNPTEQFMNHGVQFSFLASF